MIDDFLSVPVAQKHLVKHSKVWLLFSFKCVMYCKCIQWVQNDSFVDELKRWKYPDAERVVVLMLECDVSGQLILTMAVINSLLLVRILIPWKRYIIFSSARTFHWSIFFPDSNARANSKGHCGWKGRFGPPHRQ
jgi:hypothetical protein